MQLLILIILYDVQLGSFYTMAYGSLNDRHVYMIRSFYTTGNVFFYTIGLGFFIWLGLFFYTIGSFFIIRLGSFVRLDCFFIRLDILFIWLDRFFIWIDCCFYTIGIVYTIGSCFLRLGRFFYDWIILFIRLDHSFYTIGSFIQQKYTMFDDEKRYQSKRNNPSDHILKNVDIIFFMYY